MIDCINTTWLLLELYRLFVLRDFRRFNNLLFGSFRRLGLLLPVRLLSPLTVIIVLNRVKLGFFLELLVFGLLLSLIGLLFIGNIRLKPALDLLNNASLLLRFTFGFVLFLLFNCSLMMFTSTRMHLFVVSF